MPTVQTYGPRKVGTSALPGVRKTAAETPLSTGAGLEQAKAQTGDAIAGLGGQVGRVSAQVAQIVDAEKQRADETALLDAQNQLSTWEHQRLYDPQAGALAVKGKDAMPLPEVVGAEFTKVSSTVAAGLKTDRQRQAFARISLDRAQNLDLTLRRHVFGEMQTYEAGELKAFVENGTQSAIANAFDPRRVGTELDKVEAAIKTSAPRLGLGPAETQAAIGAAQSQIHVGVIDRLLSSDKPKAAQAYYEAAKDQISGQALANVEKALEEGTLRGDAQKQSDAIIQAGGTLTAQREKVRAIDDPKLRDEVMQRIEHESDVNARAEREQTEQQSTQGYDILDRTHSVASIPAPLWASYSGGTRSAMRSYAESLAKGEPVETDPVTYYALMTQAGSDPAAFVKQNLLNYKSKLAPAAWKEAVDLQRSFRTNDLKQADAQLAGFRTKDQILKNSLTQYGIPAEDSKQTDEQRLAVANLGRLLDQHVAALETGGKKASNAEIQQVVDDLMRMQRAAPGTRWPIWPLSLLPAPDSTTDVTKLIDIPLAERQQIEESMRRQRPGRPISEADVLAVYVKAHK